jgi:hypothetical protein
VVLFVQEEQKSNIFSEYSKVDKTHVRFLVAALDTALHDSGKFRNHKRILKKNIIIV